MSKLRVNIFAEKFIGEANGVTTAVLECIESLKKRDDIELQIDGSEPYDVLHSHTIGMGFVKKSWGKRKKTVVSAHVVPDSFIGSLIFSRLWQPLAKQYLKFIYDRASVVVAVSPVVKEELTKIGVKARIEVLCNSVDRVKFRPDAAYRSEIRAKFGLKDNEKIALCVGQIQPRKGIEDFLKTAVSLPEIKFMWVGGRPYGRLTEEFDKMTRLVDNAPKNVIFAGIINFEDMPKYYAAADIYFMPSYQENFAFATIEAASVKLPLVTRDNPEYPGTLFDHYLSASNAEGFTKLISKLATDQSFFKEYQGHSDQLANMYEVNAYTDKLVAIYRSIC